jgi:hypothetical protein
VIEQFFNDASLGQLFAEQPTSCRRGCSSRYRKSETA